MSHATISFTSSRPKDSTGNPVAEGCDIPTMRPRTGKRGTDAEMIKLLESSLELLSKSDCSFWACDGPGRPQAMATCSKCHAMREVATVLSTLKARE